MSNSASSLPLPLTLAGRLWPARDEGRFAALRAILLIALGTALLTLSAKIEVPFRPVPMTMQTLVVLVIGATYGLRLAGATVAAYILQGALGLPVFAGPVAGVAYLMGPTGGFILGFLAAALVTGFMAERGFDRSLIRITVMMFIGHAIIFIAGLGWLSTVMPLAQAWALGAMPFMAATLLKTALAVALVQSACIWTGRS